MTSLPQSVAQAVLQLYEALPARGKPVSSRNHTEYTVLAGVVVSITHILSSSDNSQCLHGLPQAEINRPLDAPIFRVVSLGTGTKCLNRDEVSPCGLNLCDSHAEVIARRAFIRYLYRCALYCLEFNITDDLSCPYETHGPTNFLRLRPNWRFHLYVSDSPCGDAAIYDRVSGESRFTGAKLTQRSAEDIETVKEGQQAVSIMRTKCGRSDIDDRRRSTSMSCSDKILRWWVRVAEYDVYANLYRSILGLQGSLLTLFASPIFLSTVVVGADPIAREPSQQQALDRALVTRIEASLLPDSSSRLACYISSEGMFALGKASTEARLSCDEETHFEKEESSDRNSKKRKKRCGYPAGFCMNWVANVPHGHRVVEKHAFECKGGSLEVTVASTGYVQGSGKKRSLSEAADEDFDALDPRQDPHFGHQSRLCRYEMTVLFLEICNKCMQQEIFGELLKDSSGLNFQLLKELNKEYRSHRRYMLSNKTFESYMSDDPEEGYRFKVLI